MNGRVLIPWDPIEIYVREYLAHKRVLVDMDAESIVVSGVTEKSLYLFHMILPDAPSLVLVVTTESFALLAVRPDLVGDKHPHASVKRIFDATVVDHTGAVLVSVDGDGDSSSAGGGLQAKESKQSSSKNLRGDIRVCFVLPLNALGNASTGDSGVGALASSSLDPAETATNTFQKLKLRLRTPQKGTGLRLSHLEAMLLQRLSVMNGKFGSSPEESEMKLRGQMSKAAFRDAQWFPCLQKCGEILGGVTITAAPRNNLKRILQFVKQVQSFLQECVGPDEALGADDLVPATIYCLVAGCAHVLARERPLLVVRLIYEMAPMTGEEEYGVANFEGAFR